MRHIESPKLENLSAGNIQNKEFKGKQCVKKIKQDVALINLI